MTDSWRVCRGASLLAMVVTLTTFARHQAATTPGAAARSTARTHRQWHNKPGWPAPQFKEPIQGVKVANKCTFPSYDEVSKMHRGLVVTMGEENTETCAGVMYFGDWFKQLKQLQDEAIRNGARTDTARAERKRGRG